PWAYHVDHWFADRFTHTLQSLGFGSIQTTDNTWPHEPYLSNVSVVAQKVTERSILNQLRIADELLSESMVSPKEKPMLEIWTSELRRFLDEDIHSFADSADNPIPGTT